MKPRCALSADQQTVTFKIKDWMEQFPVSKLPSRIAFYESLRDRKDRKYAATYAPSVEALKKIKQRISQ